MFQAPTRVGRGSGNELVTLSFTRDTNFYAVGQIHDPPLNPDLYPREHFPAFQICSRRLKSESFAVRPPAFSPQFQYKRKDSGPLKAGVNRNVLSIIRSLTDT